MLWREQYRWSWWRYCNLQCDHDFNGLMIFREFGRQFQRTQLLSTPSKLTLYQGSIRQLFDPDIYSFYRSCSSWWGQYKLGQNTKVQHRYTVSDGRKGTFYRKYLSRNWSRVAHLQWANVITTELCKICCTREVMPVGMRMPLASGMHCLVEPNPARTRHATCTAVDINMGDSTSVT